MTTIMFALPEQPEPRLSHLRMLGLRISSVSSTQFANKDRCVKLPSGFCATDQNVSSGSGAWRHEVAVMAESVSANWLCTGAMRSFHTQELPSLTQAEAGATACSPRTAAKPVITEAAYGRYAGASESCRDAATSCEARLRRGGVLKVFWQ